VCVYCKFFYFSVYFFFLLLLPFYPVVLPRATRPPPLSITFPIFLFILSPQYNLSRIYFSTKFSYIFLHIPFSPLPNFPNLLYVSELCFLIGGECSKCQVISLCPLPLIMNTLTCRLPSSLDYEHNYLLLALFP